MNTLKLKDILIDSLSKRPKISPVYEGFTTSMKTGGLKFDTSKKLYQFSIDLDGQITEAIDWEFPHEELGGIITFSTEVNAMIPDGNTLFERIKVLIKRKLSSWINKMKKNSKIENTIMKKHGISNISIGNFFKGKYKAKSEQIFDEKSMSVEIIGITESVLNEVARDLCLEFDQETVLVKNNINGSIYLVNYK